MADGNGAPHLLQNPVPSELTLSKGDYKELVDLLDMMVDWIWPSPDDLQRRYDRIRGIRCSCGTAFATWQRSCFKCGAERTWMRDMVTRGSDGKYHRVHRASRPLSLREAKNRVLWEQAGAGGKKKERPEAHPIELVVGQFMLAVLERCPNFLSSGRQLFDHSLGCALKDDVAFPPDAFQEMARLTAAKGELVERWKKEGEELPDDPNEDGRRPIVHRILDATLESFGMSEAQRKIGRRYLRAPTAKERLRERQWHMFLVWRLDRCDVGGGRVDFHGAMNSLRTWRGERFPDVPVPSVKAFSEMMTREAGILRDDSSHDHRVIFTGISLRPSAD